MQSTKAVESYGTGHLIERRILLSNVLKRAANEAHAAESENRFRFITVSRDVGSLGDTIAEELAGHLGWQVFDKELVNSISQNSHVRENLVRELDEHSQGLIQDTINRFLGMVEGKAFGVEDYHQALVKSLAYLAVRGDAVIVGRGANFALHGDPHGLHLRITASTETRSARVSEQWQLSRQEAQRRIAATDNERKNFIRRHFHRNITDEGFYDIIYDTDRMDTEHVIASILAIASMPAQTSKSEQKLHPAREQLF